MRDGGPHARSVAEIPVPGRVSGLAGLRGVDDVHQLAGGHVMVMEVGVRGGEMREGTVKLPHGAAQEHVHVRGDSAMGMKLCKNPVGPPRDMDVKVEPELQACKGWRIVRSQVAILDAREEPPFAPAPVKAEGTLDEEETGRIDDANPGRAPVIVGLWTVRRRGVIDGVDDGSLGGVGSGRHREIGVATGLLKNAQLIGDAAMGAGRVGIVERPVAMDEAEADRARGISGKQAVAGKIAFSLFKGGGEVFSGVVLVMEMDFRFAPSGPAKPGECGKNLRVGLLDGMKKGMGERVPARVADGIGERRELFLPAVETGESLALRGAMERLEMIADAEDEMGLA